MAKRKYTEARYRATRKYEAHKYWRPSIILPKEAEEKIRARAEQNGESISGYITRLVLADLDNQ